MKHDLKGDKKEFIVFGLGRFGRSVAFSLAAKGYEVMAVDMDEDLVQEASEIVTHAIALDATDLEALEEIPLASFDVAIISMSNNMDASILATILCKEKGVPYILANAKDSIHEKILRKLGADKVIFPEKEIGEKIAHNLTSNTFLDFIELSTNFSIAEMEVREDWVGKNLKEINLRKNYGLNAIGTKKDGITSIHLNPDQPLEAGEILIMIGAYDSFKEIGLKG